MDQRYIPDSTTVDALHALAQKAAEIKRLFSAMVVDACTIELASSDPDAIAAIVDRITKAEEAVGSLAYDLHPQSEWIGTDRDGTRHFRYRWPHAVKR